MNTVELKEAIKTFAAENSVALPNGWHMRGEEKLQALYDELTSPVEASEPVAQPVVATQAVDGEKLPGNAPETQAAKATHMSDVELKVENKTFLKKLQAEEYVDIEIDPTSLYPEGSTVPIGLNGVTFHVPVGIFFEKGVPKSIKAVWDYSKRETRKANTAMKKKLTAEIKIQ